MKTPSPAGVSIFFSLLDLMEVPAAPSNLPAMNAPQSAPQASVRLGLMTIVLEKCRKCKDLVLNEFSPDHQKPKKRDRRPETVSSRRTGEFSKITLHEGSSPTLVPREASSFGKSPLQSSTGNVAPKKASSAGKSPLQSSTRNLASKKASNSGKPSLEPSTRSVAPKKASNPAKPVEKKKSLAS